MGDTRPLPEPRYLSRSEAAHYLGVSETTFTLEVAAGSWPPGRRRGLRNGRITWDRRLLDLWADRDSGLGSETQQLPQTANIEEALALERSGFVPTPHRHKGGRAKAA